jgi:hypothetical protein
MGHITYSDRPVPDSSVLDSSVPDRPVLDGSVLVGSEEADFAVADRADFLFGSITWEN